MFRINRFRDTAPHTATKRDRGIETDAPETARRITQTDGQTRPATGIRSERNFERHGATATGILGELNGLRLHRWRRVCEAEDREANTAESFEYVRGDASCSESFHRFSSGHKSLLMTVSRGANGHLTRWRSSSTWTFLIN